MQRLNETVLSYLQKWHCLCCCSQHNLLKREALTWREVYIVLCSFLSLPPDRQLNLYREKFVPSRGDTPFDITTITNSKWHQGCKNPLKTFDKFKSHDWRLFATCVAISLRYIYFKTCDVESHWAPYVQNILDPPLPFNVTCLNWCNSTQV